MKMALHDLKLDQIHVIYPGKKDYQVSGQVYVFGLESYLQSQ